MEAARIGYLEIAAAAVLWGSNGVIVTVLPLASYGIAFLRLTVGCAALLLGLAATGRLSLLKTSHMRGLSLLGLLLALGWVLLFESMKRLTISEAVLLNYNAPIFVALLSPPLLGERLEKGTYTAVALASVGVALMALSRGGLGASRSITGVLLGLAAGLAYALFVILSKHMLEKVPSLTVSFYSYLLAAAWITPLIIGLDFALPRYSWILVLVLGVVNTALAVSVYLHGLKQVKAQDAAVLAYLEPASATAFGYVFLRETLNYTAILGGILIILGGYITLSKARRHPLRGA
ncbi:MAG: DMT family transporter [Candidatus Bathyarchaeia archaeon]|nr:EamA family transporter [Candidatus Bathyarchaeota archaeon]